MSAKNPKDSLGTKAAPKAVTETASESSEVRAHNFYEEDKETGVVYIVVPSKRDPNDPSKPMRVPRVTYLEKLPEGREYRYYVRASKARVDNGVVEITLRDALRREADVETLNNYAFVVDRCNASLVPNLARYLEERAGNCLDLEELPEPFKDGFLKKRNGSFRGARLKTLDMEAKEEFDSEL